MEQLAGYLEGQHGEPPEIDAARCRFGQWHASHGQRRFGELPEYAALTRVHGRIHGLGQAILELAQGGQVEQARARLPEMYDLRDELLTLLRRLKTTALTVL